MARDFGAVVAGASANPAVSVARAGQVVRYLSDNEAVVRGPRGLKIERSTTPLRVDVAGGKRPVDLRLHASGAAFAPVASVTGVSIAKDSSAGVALGGLRVALVGADVPGRVVGGQSVFFPEVGTDMDASVAPTVHGAELFAVLRSRLSPEQVRYRVSLPAGASLQMTPEGGAAVVRGGVVLADIKPPSARDAQGSEVPVSMLVVGGELLLTVMHRRMSVAYPVLVDPSVTLKLGGLTPGSEVRGGWPALIKWSGGAFFVSGPATKFPLEIAKGTFLSGGVEGELIIPVPKAMHLETAEFLGVSATKSESPATGFGTEWELTACSAQVEGFSAPPSSVVLHYEAFLEPCSWRPRIVLTSNLLGVPPESPEGTEATDGGSTSVESIVLTVWPSLQEEEEWESAYYGLHNRAMLHDEPCVLGKPVNCATGNQVESQTDLAVGGRGPGLAVTRTYNSRRASLQSRISESAGPFGYGWTGPASAHLEPSTPCILVQGEGEGGWGGSGGGCGWPTVTVYEDDGSSARFLAVEGKYKALGPRVKATLVAEGSGYLYTLPDQTKLTFNEAGQLTARTDRNGNATSMKWSGGGLLESISDAAGRKLTFAYNAEKEVESITDPMGHVVKYGYEAKNLTSVTEPGESSPRWRFKYSEHEMTEMTDGRGNTITTEYEGHRVVKQKDALGRVRKWSYGGEPAHPETTITEPNGSTTVEKFNAVDQLTSVTHASGTGSEAKTTMEYGEGENLIAVTDPNKHTTKYAYNASGDRTSATDPLGHKTKWEYNGTHDVTSITTPDGETTTIKRDAHGNPEVIERPAPGATTQATKYKVASNGDLESVEDPLKRVTKYEYDTYGDRKAEIDPESNKRAWVYNEDSQLTSIVTPRGNAAGAEASKFTTSIERDAQGRPLVVTEPEARGASKPADRSVPVISGMLWEGQTLKAGTGVWEGTPSMTYAYQWQRCNIAGAECAAISGATESKYVVAKADVGLTLRVAVTGTDSLGSAASTSAASAVICAVAPPAYSSTFGSFGTENGQLIHPMGEAVDSHGNLWVADAYNSRIEKFSSSGTWLATYGKYGTGKGEFEEPVGLAVNQTTGNVYIGDQNNNRVQELNEKGEWVRTWEGHEGAFKEPDGVAIDSKANVWVTDSSNNRVEEFNEKGEYLSKFGSTGSGNGQFQGPAELAFSGTHVYVTDLNNSRAQEFTEKGEYVSKFGEWGTAAGRFEYPVGISARSSKLYVGDSGNNRIQELTTAGAFQASFGTTGSGPGQFADPEFAVFNSSGEIYVSDSENNRIEKWVPAGVPSNTAAAGISGQLLVGQTLTASNGVWVASPAPTYTYQWQRCNRSGGECSSISGATSSTHVIVTADLNTTLRVVVTATNTGGNKASTSAASEPVPGPRTTTYAYDANGNLETVVDPNGNKTKYVYDADNEPTKVEQPNGTSIETGYDSEGQVTTQTDGNKHTTEYVRDLFERVTEVIDPLKRKTVKEYDSAGNLVKLTDPLKRVTTNTYNEANQLTETSYSDGKTHAVKYEYNGDGYTTKMTDGTGETITTYDQLERPTEVQNGHKETIGYEYDLDNEQTKITYPNTKAITRAFDKDGRLEKLTDWSSNSTKFAYDQDSDLTATIFPPATSNEDKYTYNEADQMTEVKMSKSSETLAIIGYARDNNGQVKNTSQTGLPGEALTGNEYDPNSRLTKAGATGYEYDAANNPTKQGANTYTYSSASELETGPGTAKYTFNEQGQRTKTTPATGPANTYGYDQANNLTTITRPEEGATPKIEDSYTSDGTGLRASQTINGTTTYMAWDTTEPIPLLLTDTTNSYIYGPEGLPTEQISSGGTVTYLHHDQAGSTRLMTSSTGTKEASYTYDAYGNQTGHTGTVTAPLGYDGEYTSADTGLIYLRARVYDPATGQFLSVDPLAEITGARYGYAGENPLSYSDSTGLSVLGIKPPSWVEMGIEGLAGWGDTLTFGATKWVRERLGDENVNTCSGAYKIGGYAGLATGVLIPGEGEAELGADEARIAFGHGVRHLEGTGLSQEEVERAIEEQVRTSVGGGTASGQFAGRVDVGGTTIEYRGYGLDGGGINIGTYYPLP